MGTRRRRPTRDSSDSDLCELDFKSESDVKWPPIFYRYDGEFIFPEKVFYDDVENTTLDNDTNVGVAVAVNTTQNVITVACPGSKLKLTGQERALFRCVDNSLVPIDLVDQEPVKYSDLSCTKSIEENLMLGNHSCGPHDQPGQTVHIGWTLEGDFKPIISLCHSEVAEHTHFAFHKINGKSLSARDRNRKRKSGFKEGVGFYLKTVANSLYKLKNQEKVFRENGLARFLNRSEDVVLNRGHLAPNSDFIYKEWQDATFYYLNVAPQWKKFNAGNWLQVELQTRWYAQRTNKDLEIYTGTYKTLQLPNDQGELQEVFLDRRKLIPVPLFFWKIVHDVDDNAAIVFVGVNSPEDDDEVQPELQICPDVCDSAKWSFPDKGDAKMGLLFCCSYQYFKSAVPWIDFLKDPILLENRPRNFKSKESKVFKNYL